jgi:DNA-binding MarR family transcriptional regulator
MKPPPAIKRGLTAEGNSGSARALAAFQEFVAALGRHASDSMLDINLTMPQYRALRTIQRLGPVSGRGLARELGVSPAAVVPVCDRLEALGYLERVRDTADRRVWWLQLTTPGAEVLSGLSALIEPHIHTALASLTQGDRERLAQMLEHMAEALSP